MKIAIAVLFFGIGSAAIAQEAAQATVDLGLEKTETPTPAPTAPPDVPELSQLDQVYKQTSLGKTADEYRIRIEWRNLQNEAGNDPVVVTARREAESARTDLEKRERLRSYYETYYERMRVRASSAEMKKALDTFKAEHLQLLAQPRVRPTGDDAAAATPAPKKTKHKHAHKEGGLLQR